jgi:hypothetical protein
MIDALCLQFFKTFELIFVLFLTIFCKQLRALWYMLMTAAEDIEVQKNGIVHVGYEIGEYVAVDFELVRQLFRCARTLPVRVVAGHTCYSEKPMSKAVDLVVHMLSSFTRLRFRFHCGKFEPGVRRRPFLF